MEPAISSIEEETSSTPAACELALLEIDWDVLEISMAA
jgi:hypothetical protein